MTCSFSSVQNFNQIWILYIIPDHSFLSKKREGINNVAYVQRKQKNSKVILYSFEAIIKSGAPSSDLVARLINVFWLRRLDFGDTFEQTAVTS